METNQDLSQDEYEIQRLGQLCLPRWYDRIQSPVVRPERPEFAMTTKGQPTNIHWRHALEDMHTAIKSYRVHTDSNGKNKKWKELRLHQGAKSVKSDKGSFSGREEEVAPLLRPPRPTVTPLESFFKDMHALQYSDDLARPLLTAISLILYDQNFSGAPPPKINEETRIRYPFPFFVRLREYRDLVQHMLLIDYGIGKFPVGSLRGEKMRYIVKVCTYLVEFAGRCREGQLPTLNEWRVLGMSFVLCCLSAELMPEVLLALYYFHTHRQADVDDDVYNQGYAGYEGIMQELVDEIPARGPDRLLRKLSVDVHILIPRCCRDYRRQLTAAAVKLAVQHGLQIYAPEVKEGVKIPEFDTTHRDGYPKTKKKAIFLNGEFGKYYFSGICIGRLRPIPSFPMPSCLIMHRERYRRNPFFFLEYSDAEYTRRLAAKTKKVAEEQEKK